MTLGISECSSMSRQAPSALGQRCYLPVIHHNTYGDHIAGVHRREQKLHMIVFKYTTNVAPALRDG